MNEHSQPGFAEGDADVEFSFLARQANCGGSTDLEEQKVDKEEEARHGEFVTGGGELAAEVLCFSLEAGWEKALLHLSSVFREVFGPTGQF